MIADHDPGDEHVRQLCSCGRERADRADLDRWKADCAAFAAADRYFILPADHWSRVLCWTKREARCNMRPLAAAMELAAGCPF